MQQIMNKISLVFLAAIVSGAANAATFTFQPSDKKLDNLDHYYAYSWGLKWNVPQGEKIVGATLTIKDIWNWKKEENILYVNLLDNPSNGVKKFWDNQGGGNYFKNQGPLIGTWSDLVGGKSRNFDLKFDLGEAGLIDKLNDYAKDGKFGFGFDPDCHFYNKGVELQLTTASEAVPEPATMAGLVMAGAALAARRFKKRA